MQYIRLRTAALLRSMADLNGISIGTKMRLHTYLTTHLTDSVIRLRDLDTHRSGRKKSNCIHNDIIENHTGSAQTGQDTQRRTLEYS